MGPLTKEIPQIDLRSIWQVIRLRWWIVPLCLVVSAGLMFAQESDLQTSPVSILVSKTYGPRDELANLAAFGVDLNSVREFPSFQNQLAIVRDSGPKQVLSSLGKSVDVSVMRTEPQVSMLATADGDGRQLFTVSANGQANYVINCSAPEESTCDSAIDVFVGEIESVRRDAIIDGLRQLQTRIESVLGSLSSAQPQLEIQHASINSAIDSITGKLQFVDGKSEASGGTVATVKISTYAFGLAVGLIIALLIILQLTLTDDKIRSSKKLRGVLDSSQFLIDLTTQTAATDLKFVLAGVLHGLTEANSTDVVFVPIDNDAKLGELFEIMAGESVQQGLTIQKSSALSALSTGELLNMSTKSIVLVVAKHASRLTSLEESLTNLKQSGARVLGLLLVDSRI
jgi:hypothetical protein